MRSLLCDLAHYLEARGRLFQIEAQEAGTRFAGIAVTAAFMLGCLFFGWLLALPALLWLLAESQGWPWHRVALGAGGAHLLLGLIFMLALRARLRALRVFEETFNQFQKDREWIAGGSNH